ncbi:MAG: RidA family protein [Chloroflexi bacterium]|jgi:2-iminobutanoate/2-iminopropanoate deaminase|nr:RidA family protein [Chloroflexota bacterium]
MTARQTIHSDQAPKAIGPYSAAVRAGEFIFLSGQLGIDPDSGELVPGGIQEETRQALKNARAILEAAGSSLDRVVKTTVFLRDINDFASMNAAYAEFFTGDYPARSAFQVGALPRGAAVEIEMIALAG